MKIALVSDAIWPYFRGGKERRITEVSKRLVAAGHEVHIYTMQWWGGPRVVEQEGVWLHAICKQYSLYAGERRSIKQGIIFGMSCFRLLREQFDVADVDHMPYFPLYSMRIVCWLKRRPLVATWHEVWCKQTWQQYLGRVLGLVAYGIERIAAALPTAIIAVSPATAQKLHTVYGVSQQRLTLAVNGIDIESIVSAKPAAFRSDIMYVGRLIKHKNVDMLVRAIADVSAEMPEVRAIIVGKGPESRRLHALAEQLKVADNITFIPHVAESRELYGIMKASRVFVLPSAREGFGLVAVEANAAGLPVLTLEHPDNAAATLVFNGKNGDVFTDAATLANLLRQYLHPAALPADYSAYTEAFDWDKATCQVIQRYAA